MPRRKPRAKVPPKPAVVEKRESGGKPASPPLMIVRSYENMTPQGRRRLRIAGALMLILSITLPLVGGLFVELSAYYWIFSGVITVAGLCLLWPELGLWLVNAIPNALVKILPSKLLSRPDRRTNSEDQE